MDTDELREHILSAFDGPAEVCHRFDVEVTTSDHGGAANGQVSTWRGPLELRGGTWHDTPAMPFPAVGMDVPPLVGRWIPVIGDTSDSDVGTLPDLVGPVRDLVDARWIRSDGEPFPTVEAVRVDDAVEGRRFVLTHSSGRAGRTEVSRLDRPDGTATLTVTELGGGESNLVTIDVDADGLPVSEDATSRLRLGPRRHVWRTTSWRFGPPRACEADPPAPEAVVVPDDWSPQLVLDLLSGPPGCWPALVHWSGPLRDARVRTPDDKRESSAFLQLENAGWVVLSISGRWPVVAPVIGLPWRDADPSEVRNFDADGETASFDLGAAHVEAHRAAGVVDRVVVVSELDGRTTTQEVMFDADGRPLTQHTASSDDRGPISADLTWETAPGSWCRPHFDVAPWWSRRPESP